ncbi:ParB N-terminal domain-containing protein [Rhodobacter sp. NTK016B]|uniref:ParB N-terminal domain-containing protein n=1 Tax=Rhodobacter sp. NTK016B TaxID=2759676 RepID=UPI001A8C2E7A|nr:ParB N-terminal domain-containing protein [Rhodobacter sp. NTK016B]MBN8292838.1 ParB N-terminal domain-containing protein [Rhodobacter sp. NTK016B]
MSLRIDQIRRNGGTQSRAGLNEATVAEYAEAMSDPNTVFPPVVVYQDGTDYWLADGFHRVAAWERIGRTEIPTDIRQGDRRRAILHSVSANSAHGLRRTNEDKRRAVLTLLEDDEWSAWSNREIARRCAVSDHLVADVRAGFTAFSRSDAENAARTYTTKHGTTATMNTTNIGAGSKPDQQKVSTPERAEAADFASDRTLDRADTSAPEAAAPVVGQEPADPAEAKARRELARLTPEALIDEVLGLRAALADERGKRREAEQRAADLKEKIAVFEDGHDMGAKLGRALAEIDKTKGRMKETQTQLARETRRANAMQKARDELQAKLEAQIIPMDGAA